MAPRYHRLTITLVALVTFVVASAGTAPAQFMYLDADGDGVPTSADVVPPDGSLTFDVWLVTDRNRDGSAPSCAQDPGGAMTLGGYGFVLKVTNGSVTFSAVANQIPSFALGQVQSANSLELSYSIFGESPLPPGKYRLATVTAQTTLGTPAISIVPATQSGPLVQTGFYSSCPGVAYDYLLRLASDWSDVEGLPFGGQDNRAPILAPIAPMAVAEGDTAVQDVASSDLDGQAIALAKTSGPAYMTLTQTGSFPGSSTGSIRLSPGYSDAGTAAGSVQATDGILTTEATFGITVTNVNRPPVLLQPNDMEVEAGTSDEQPLYASDPDGGLSLVLLEGPDFAWIQRGTFHVSPAPTEAAAQHRVGVRATDGSLYVDRSFYVTVFGTKTPPYFGSVTDMAVAEGDTVTQVVQATDPDGDFLSFYTVQFPPFMRLETISSAPFEARARIVLTPRVGDRGQANVGIGVTDGVFQIEARFLVTVFQAYAGATWLSLRIDPQPSGLPWSTIRFDAQEGAFGAAGDAAGGVTVTFDTPEPMESWSTVRLSCLPAQRATCLSGRVNFWQLSFQPPIGGTLRPGLYGGAGEARDAQHPGLSVRQWCPTAYACSASDSWFEVRQIEFDPSGAVRSFWATFEHRCSDSPTVISGEVRYNAEPPVFVDAPARVPVHAGDLFSMDLPIRGSGTGPFAVDCPDLPFGASLFMISPDLANLSWTPGLDQAGGYDLRLIARASDATPDTTTMHLCVDVPGAVTARMDANRTEVVTTNRGAPAWDALGDGPGAYHPAGSGVPVADGIGLILAARVNGAVRLSHPWAGVVNPYVPGPIVNGAPAPSDPRYKNYTIRRAAPFGYDWDHWPVDQGAPVDAAGHPLILGDVTIWSLYNDAYVPVPPAPARGTPPLNVEVRQTTWASASPTPLGDVVYQRFQIRNAGADTLEQAYAALRVDASTWDYYGDLGSSSRGLAGCDTTLGLGYAYGSRYCCARPNAVGVVILHGPAVIGAGGESDTLGLSAFQNVGYSGSDFVGSVYNQLQGLLPGGSPRHEMDDPAGPVTRFAYTGDPVAGSGWLYPDSPYSTASFYVSTGPFRLAPGEEHEVLAAIVAATGGERLDAVRRLRAAAAAARSQETPVGNRAPLIIAEDGARVTSGDTLRADVLAEDPDGDPVVLTAENLPSGATFVSTGAGRALLTWAPAASQAGTYTISLIAEDGRGGRASRAFVLVVVRANHPPIADAGGPYEGLAGVPIRLDASGSSDPDGDPLSLTWSLGDGGTARGTQPSYTFAEGGQFAVILQASDGLVSDNDSTTAAVAAADSATAWVLPGDEVIRLRSARPTVWIAVEPRDARFAPADVLLPTVGLFRVDVPSGSIAPDGEKIRVGVDENHDGVAEVLLGFAKEDLRRLFQDLPAGRSGVPAVITGALAGGGSFAAPITLLVEAGRAGLDASVAPNPFNPSSTLTIRTTRPGPVRVVLFDVTGRAVRMLLAERSLEAGYYDIPLDRRSGGGSTLSSGIYFYRVESAEGVAAGRFIVLK